MDSKTRAFVNIACPYCGTPQTQSLVVGSPTPQIVLCDCENVPGCDRYFVVAVRVQYNIEYSAIVNNVKRARAEP